jgi:hypothetical protein
MNSADSSLHWKRLQSRATPQQMRFSRLASM